jgi:hypothetical protein
VTNWNMMADGNAFPEPTRQGEVTNTSGSGVVPPGNQTAGAAASSFLKPPGQAPGPGANG